MIYIDFKQYIQDRMWFGWHYDDDIGINTTANRAGKSHWYYSHWWTLRCWPCLREGKVVPLWWVRFFERVGLVPDHEEGLE